MEKSTKERILSICSELGEDMESPACQKLRKYVASCPECEAFVDSVKKTILLYQAYRPSPSPKARQRLVKILNLDE